MPWRRMGESKYQSTYSHNDTKSSLYILRTVIPYWRQVRFPFVFTYMSEYLYKEAAGPLEMFVFITLSDSS
jgi:hypothetical protein